MSKYLLYLHQLFCFNKDIPFSRMIFAVSTARPLGLDIISENLTFSNLFPNNRAYYFPFSVNRGSSFPCIRPSLFHTVSPCLTRYMHTIGTTSFFRKILLVHFLMFCSVRTIRCRPAGKRWRYPETPGPPHPSIPVLFCPSVRFLL